MKFHHNLERLERDFIRSSKGYERDIGRAVERTAKYGWRKAFRLAKKWSGSHGSRYPYAIDVERHSQSEWEYFTNPAKPQGNMDFEQGSGRQARPHPAFTQSSDGLAVRLEKQAGTAVRRSWKVT